MCFLACITLAALLLQEPARPVRPPKAIIEDILKENSGCNSSPSDFTAQATDLDGDGKTDYVVKAENSCFCGSGGCTAWVYRAYGQGYDLIFEIELAGPITVKRSKTNRFFDLVVERSFGATHTFITQYKWDGSQYVASVCTRRVLVGERDGKPFFRTEQLECGRPDPDPPTAPDPEPRPPRPTAIVNESFTVGAGAWKFYQFVVPGNVSGHVVGRVQAQGGTGNDIEVFILDRDGYVNWSNGHAVNTWFNAGRITVTNVSAELPPGQYYLVFSNRYSVVSPKAVSARIDIQ